MQKLFAIFFLIFFPANAFCDAVEFRLGAIIHLTGDIAAPSESFRQGIETAIEEANNSQDKILIKLTLEDGQNNPKSSYMSAQKLISVDKVDAVILESVVDVMTSGKLFERHKIPSICIWDSNPEIEEAGDYIFAIGPWTPSAGEVTARFARDKLNASKAVIFANVETWSESVKTYFEKEFTKNGGKVLQTILINPQDAEFRAEILRAISLKPEVIYAPLVFNLPAFHTQLKTLGNTVPVVSSDIVTEEYIKEAPAAFEGMYQSSVPDPRSESYERFETKFEKKFKSKPDHPWFAAVGYDAVMLFVEAVSKGSDKAVSREMVKDGLYKIKDFKGASSVITINEKGAFPQNEVMFQLVNGKFELVK